MQFPTQIISKLAVLLSILASASAIAIPPTSTFELDLVDSGSDFGLGKRIALAEAAAVTPKNTPTIVPGPESDGTDVDDIGIVPEVNDEPLEPLTSEDEALLKQLQSLPDDGDDDDDDDDVTLTRREAELEERGLISPGRIIALLWKKISIKNLARRVWNALGAVLRSKIVKRFKRKTIRTITAADKSWLGKIIKPFVLKALRSIIGRWGAKLIISKVLGIVVKAVLLIIF